MRARDQSSIFSTGKKFRPDYGLLLELHALILVARSYALLTVINGLFTGCVSRYGYKPVVSYYSRQDTEYRFHTKRV